ncbi:MAG TPA: 3-hydroxyacyl-CoA dehydrogenase NAD-binding domain-containing protein [Candidatus Limnocylindria bacterium]|nr:3-hydroxyacyl-CoA dehydrogenase NAD-binding domain-containing protein [Candidatus Limnocylindria bacterium]
MTDLERVGVLGAGTMGAGIAQVAAEAGLGVRLLDPVDGAYERARDRIGGFLERKVAKGQLHAGAADEAMARISEAGSVADLTATGFVIEAIPEDLDLKRDAFRRLSAAAPREAVLATNTSSLSVEQIAVAAAQPDRVVGMHFFNPVPLMALVEVIAAPRTDRAVVAATTALAARLGKTPVEAADTPGFIVNRVARPFYLESLRILGEGAADAPTIDAALRDAGFRMGPFELVDTIGLDVNLAVSHSVWTGFDRAARYAPQALQSVLVDAGRLGRKSGAGFYDWSAAGERGSPWSGLPAVSVGAAALPAEAITERVLATIVNEAASAVEDRTASPEAIDTAMRLGTNWPQGPLAWGEARGLGRAVATLDRLAATAPDARYAVVALLRSLASRGGSFFTTAS